MNHRNCVAGAGAIDVWYTCWWLRQLTYAAYTLRNTTSSWSYGDYFARDMGFAIQEASHPCQNQVTTMTNESKGKIQYWTRTYNVVKPTIGYRLTGHVGFTYLGLIFI